MAKKYKAPVRGKVGSSAEVIDPVTGQYAGTQYRRDYPLYDEQGRLVSEGGRRVGPLQFYRRGAQSGKYQKRRKGTFGFKLRKPRGYDPDFPDDEEEYREARDTMGFNFERDIRILVCIGTVVVAFIVCYVLLNMVFDTVGEIFVATGLSSANFDSFRVQASLVLGVVVAIIVGAGASMFLFTEDEVSDAIFDG